MKFNVISSDPPWEFDDKLEKMKKNVKRSAASNYSTLNLSEIAAIDVPSVTDDEWAVLALWVPSILLSQGLHVMKVWGFEYKQMCVWGKIKKTKKITHYDDLNDALAFGMGRLFRQCHEIALIGTKGKVYKHLMNHSQRSLFLDVNKGHSTKPELLQDRLEIMFPTSKKLEMFARRQRKNWHTVGFGVDGVDIVDSIALAAALPADCDENFVEIERYDENDEII